MSHVACVPAAGGLPTIRSARTGGWLKAAALLAAVLCAAVLCAAGTGSLAAAEPALLQSPFDAAAAQAKQAEWAQHLGRQVVEKNSLGEKMVLIPPGEFLMGNQEGSAATLAKFPYVDPKEIEDELPRHKVRITRPFYLGATTITYGNFLTFYHASGYKTEAERDGQPNWGFDPKGKLIQSTTFVFWNTGWEQSYQHPAVYVSWNDAVAFCDWLSKKEGKKYRLPTEAEWEYACRAGTESRYYWGDDPEEMVHYGNGPDQDCKRALDPTGTAPLVRWEDGVKIDTKIPFPWMSGHDGYAYTAPVGKFRANPFGLYDMLGNVWQWCSDWDDDTYYQNSPADDPPGPGTGTERVSRGGSWRDTAADARCSNRDDAEPVHRDYDVGFRVVCEK